MNVETAKTLYNQSSFRDRALNSYFKKHPNKISTTIEPQMPSPNNFMASQSSAFDSHADYKLVRHNQPVRIAFRAVTTLK